VLLQRPLRTGNRLPALALRAGPLGAHPAIHHKHAKAVAVDFTEVPEPFRQPVKQVIWLLLTTTSARPAGLPVHRLPTTISTIRATARFLRAFAQCYTPTALPGFADVTATDLDAYAIDVRAAEISHGQREDMLAAVVRAWNVRTCCPRMTGCRKHRPGW